MFQCHARGLQPGPMATYPKWTELGRHVRKGEKALTLCMPITLKRKKDTTDQADQEAVFTRFVYKSRWFVYVSYRIEGGESSLVAQLVPHTRPDSLPWTPESRPTDSQLRLICEMSEAPPGVVPWMIVRTHRFTTHSHWQRGMFLEYEPHGSAFLELSDRDFTFHVRGADPAHFMSLLRDSLTCLITERWPGLRHSMAVPCDQIMDGDACRGRVKLDVLRKVRSVGQTSIVHCPECGEALSITKISYRPLRGRFDEGPSKGPAVS